MDSLIADGWHYVDPRGRFSPEMWELFLSEIGDGEYRILAYSRGVDRDGWQWERGQLLISPQGWENMTLSVKRPAPA